MDLILAALLVVTGLVLIALFLKYQLERHLNTLHEKSTQLSDKIKTENESQVRGLLKDDRDKIELIAKSIKEDLEKAKKDYSNVSSQNSEIKKHLELTRQATKDLHSTTEGLKKLLSNNRLRGEWGEQVVEELLLGAGFVEGVNFSKQQTTRQGRPDFTLFMPDGKKINIDAKFPLDDLLKYQQARDDSERKMHMSSFEKAVKNKIKEVSSKDYIDPESNTVDFVIMFIPNEMVFSFVYEQLPEVIKDASHKKVIITGPFGLTSVLRLILQAYRNFSYEKNLHEILGLISKFQDEYEKFSDEFSKIGTRLDSAKKAFNEVEGTRSRQLTRVLDKISDNVVESERLKEGKESN